MTQLESRLWEWHIRNWGPRVDVPATYRKLCEEVGELGEALMRNQQQETKMEAGDVAMLLFVLVRGLGCNGLSDVMMMVEDKLLQREATKATQ